jgi:sortase (surface protein transpeptidase)
VVVPRLGIDLPLRDGDLVRDVVDQATPVAAAFRFPGSPLPGTPGNLYVYAHARTGMFLALWKAKQGDVVELVSPSGATLRYLVNDIVPKVPINDITYLLPTDDERLTLQTSTGPNVDDPRFVVVAIPAAP